MPISSRRNSIPRMTRADQYFEIGELFIYKPLDTTRMVDKEEFMVVPTPVGRTLSCTDCDLYNYCARDDNFTDTYFVPQCEPSKRKDGENVIFVKF